MPAGDPDDQPVRVVVVDADDRVRESLTGLLEIGDRIRVVGTAGGLAEALRVIAVERPDVVVLDPRLPDANGTTPLCDRLRAVAPGVRTLVLSWSEDAGSAGRHGADAVTRKTFRPADLIAAIEAAGSRIL